jgi:hypothetical protein
MTLAGRGVSLAPYGRRQWTIGMSLAWSPMFSMSKTTFRRVGIPYGSELALRRACAALGVNATNHMPRRPVI